MGKLMVGLMRILPLCVVLLVLITMIVPTEAFADATITVNPSSGPVGQTVIATGTGWTQDAKFGDGVISIWIISLPLEVARAQVDANGEFSVSFTIPSSAPEGELRIDALGLVSADTIYTVTLAVGFDDYPRPLCPPTTQDSLVDPWLFFNRECTSFVAWRLNSTYGFPAAFTNNMVNNNITVHFGHAYQWAAAAQSLGIPIDGNPSPRAIAYWAQNTAEALESGHVAWVESVNPDGSIIVEDYNWLGTGLYRKAPISVSDVSQLQFIHFGDWFSSQLQLQQPQAPGIVRVETFREGILVFFRVFFTDPNSDAKGFGFRGSRWAEETHPFSSPSYGRMAARRSGADPKFYDSITIEYPFNHGCGTGSEIESDVEVWIYDSAGLISQSVTVPLACSAQSEEPFSCVRDAQ